MFLAPVEGTQKPPGIFDAESCDNGGVKRENDGEGEGGEGGEGREVWTKEDVEAWWANEGSCAPEFDESVYEVLPSPPPHSQQHQGGPTSGVPAIPIWNRAWDGGTGLPIRGMGLMKPGMRGFGPGSSSMGFAEGKPKKGKKGKKGGDEEDEEEDQGEEDGDDGEEGSEDDM